MCYWLVGVWACCLLHGLVCDCGCECWFMLVGGHMGLCIAFILVLWVVLLACILCWLILVWFSLYVVSLIVLICLLY